MSEEIKKQIEQIRMNITEADKQITAIDDAHSKTILMLYKNQMVTTLTLSEFMLSTEERLSKLEAASNGNKETGGET